MKINNFINIYLLEIQESNSSRIKKVIDILKDIGLETIGTFFERKECKNLRKDSKYMYLLHGTRTEYVNSIKKTGLQVKKFGQRSKAEGDVLFGKDCIWFGMAFSGKEEGFGRIGSKKRVVYMVAKVNTKFLEFSGGAYMYFKDVPPKDLIWEDDKRFIEIINKSPCLINKVRK